MKRGDRWTPEEDDLIRNYAGKRTPREIAGMMHGRTLHAVYCRAHNLGVYLSPDDWTLRRLRLFFGAWERTLKAAWLDTGLLPYHTGRGKRGGGEYRITEADLETFIRAYPWAYDAKRIRLPTHRLARLAVEVQRRDPWMDCGEVAVYLGISKSAVSRWCTKGVIPYKRRAANGRGGARNGALVVRAADLPAVRAEIARRQHEARVLITERMFAGKRASLQRQRQQGKRKVAA